MFQKACVKSIRNITFVLLALLYLGGTTAQASRAVHFHLASGSKTLDESDGKHNSPIHPTITVRRHLPLVKLVLVPPLVAIAQPVLDPPVEFRIVPAAIFSSSLQAACSASCGDRAPPRS